MAVTTSLLSEVVEEVVGAMLADYIALWREGEALTDWALVTTPALVCTVQPSTVSLCTANIIRQPPLTSTRPCSANRNKIFNRKKYVFSSVTFY